MSDKEGKTPVELKAHAISDDRFRLLAIPFGGPLEGRDLDGEYFSVKTDIKPDWFEQRPVLWNHGQDRLLNDRVIGKATLDDEPDEDGWWVEVQLLAGERHAALVQKLAQKAPLYGSSGTIGYLKRTAPDGEILVWPYVEQTLTLTPSNTLSVSRPAKAVLDDFHSAEIAVSPAVQGLLADLEALSADLTATSSVGDLSAKGGLDAVYAATGKQLKQVDELWASIETHKDRLTEKDLS